MNGKCVELMQARLRVLEQYKHDARKEVHADIENERVWRRYEHASARVQGFREALEYVTSYRCGEDG